MGRLPAVKKGAWTQEEDMLLKGCVEKYGEGKWKHVPEKAGLNRCRKSCRLRWLNYLRPNIKRGSFAVDEVDLIIRLHKLLGNRWSLIAGRIPGRTANDIKNYWNCHLSKKIVLENKISIPNTVYHGNHGHGSATNSESSMGVSGSPSRDRRQEKGEDGGEEEEEEDNSAVEEEEEEEEEKGNNSSFWRSLLIEGGEVEKNRNAENKGLMLEDDSLFVGFEDLLQDMERWGNMGYLG